MCFKASESDERGLLFPSWTAPTEICGPANKNRGDDRHETSVSWIHALLFADIIIIIVAVATKETMSMANQNLQDNSYAISVQSERLRNG